MKLILLPLAFLYWIIIFLRNLFYKMGVLKSYKLNAPVISVGNITTGGTGKTPFVDYLISKFESKNLSVGVLSRGYGRKSKKIIEVKIHHRADEVGDEPLWLKKRHPSAQIIVGSNRIKAAKSLKNVDVVILDDGFQHFKIRRQLDIILFDVTSKANDLYLLPVGDARENLKSIKRADVVIFTKSNFATPLQINYWTEKINNCGVKKIFNSEIVFGSCYDLKTKNVLDIKNKKVFLCSGIAKPKSFFEVVKVQGALVVGENVFSDHINYNDNLLKYIYEEALKAQAEIILVTEKDAVKLEKLKYEGSISIGVVSIKINLIKDEPLFYDLVLHPSN